MLRLNERITQMVLQADVNNDGVISYTEFLFAMADGSVDVEELEASNNTVEKSR